MCARTKLKPREQAIAGLTWPRRRPAFFFGRRTRLGAPRRECSCTETASKLSPLCRVTCALLWASCSRMRPRPRSVTICRRRMDASPRCRPFVSSSPSAMIRSPSRSRTWRAVWRARVLKTSGPIEAWRCARFFAHQRAGSSMLLTSWRVRVPSLPAGLGVEFGDDWSRAAAGAVVCQVFWWFIAHGTNGRVWH